MGTRNAMSEEQKAKIIRVINELKEFSMIDENIEDWKKDDDMDGPLIWALQVRLEVNELLAELEEKEKYDE